MKKQITFDECELADISFILWYYNREIQGGEVTYYNNEVYDEIECEWYTRPYCKVHFWIHENSNRVDVYMTAWYILTEVSLHSREFSRKIAQQYGFKLKEV